MYLVLLMDYHSFLPVVSEKYSNGAAAGLRMSELTHSLGAGEIIQWSSAPRGVAEA